MPPVNGVDPLDSSLDVRFDTLVEGLRGMEYLTGASADGDGSLALDSWGLVEGEVEARWAGFLATGGRGLDLLGMRSACC